jgi:hypothetical protein
MHPLMHHTKTEGLKRILPHPHTFGRTSLDDLDFVADQPLKGLMVPCNSNGSTQRLPEATCSSCNPASTALFLLHFAG